MEQKKKNPKTLLIVLLVAVIIAGAGIYYWIKSAAYETTDNAQLDGNIEPVRSSVTAYITSIRFQDNQEIKKGDTLIVFNTTALEAKVKQATAALENAKASLSISDIKALASLENAHASMLTAESNQQNILAAKANLDKAELDLARVSNLLKIKAATQEQYETVLNRLQTSKADYAQAISRQQSSVSTSQGLTTNAKAEKGQITAAQSIVKQKEAELVLAEEDLSHAYIIAPLDGIVTKRSVQEGQYISAGQTLCALIDNKHLWVSANIKETQLSKIKPGQSVDIKIDAYPDLKLTGKVASYAGATGSKFSLLPPDNATGNFIKITQRFPIRVSIDPFFGSENKPTVLFPGLSAFLKIKID
ncbi:membrane fusion protein, multidrug efflux system [Chitinophaga sp. CF118]|uniref:HlyD family secretion protein n=1 Tax=Chitinophaga sp. CF118 TaxID=1884367 RepID=UPI0008E12D92|nr:HlyD family secretion protein [Chitinophaga sp. CF118]SFE16360.1 membrane fusion protein, multidrug efflux system [Chitinophaga sp. CF118]